MTQPPDEPATVRAARTGDRDAFALLVASHQEVAFRAAYLISRDASAAEDIAQDAFIRAYTGLGTFREGEQFRPWLLRIVTNLALNHVRARGRRLGLLERFGRQHRDSEPSAEMALLERERREALWRAVSELSREDQLVLYLRYYLELPECEIAAVIERPAGTVKSRLSRASGRLRLVIERRYPGLRPGVEIAEVSHD